MPCEEAAEPAFVPGEHTGFFAGEMDLGKRLYVGNLPYTTTEDELREMFEPHGAIESVAVITDRDTGRSRGFGFVEMREASAADKAIQSLDGKDMGGRSLRVNEAHERTGRGDGGGGGRRF